MVGEKGRIRHVRVLGLGVSLFIVDAYPMLGGRRSAEGGKWLDYIYAVDAMPALRGKEATEIAKWVTWPPASCSRGNFLGLHTALLCTGGAV